MLKRVSIQNFKSLKDVTLDLQKINLLIGPNNSGKTNFLKALEYMSKLETNVHVEVSDDLLFRPTIVPYMKGEKIYSTSVNEYINVHLIHDSYFSTNRFDHTKLHAKSKGTAIRLGEKNKYYVVDGIETDNFDYDFNNRVNDPSLDSGNFKQFKYIHFENLHIYKPDPNKLIKPGPVGTGEETVAADTSNLVGFLDLMLGKYRKTVFSRTETDLHICIPEFDEISLEDTPPTEELKKEFGDKSFKRIGLTNINRGITYWADELSEGTLYFLALLCIINQPNPPKLLLLEEPEKGIHPRRIREVMDFIFRLAEEKDVQIILTTHNEHVLDDFATRPESVFVFDKDEEGATYVRNLQRDIIEPTNQHNRELGLDDVDLTTNLSENWLYGLLGGVPAIP